jgi:hypothetical protein
MDDSLLANAHDRLLRWCRERDYAGYDPFDALNSRLFQSTPLKHFSAARFAWTQLLKRSPINLRALLLVPPSRNAKAIALFALASLANYRRQKTSLAESETHEILKLLLAMRLPGWQGDAWGYNFDWQSRNFFAPRSTPMIIPTAFSARALLEAAALFADERYFRSARSSCDFILQDLNRSYESTAEVCFSYSPHTSTKIYNASLLAAEILAGVASITGEQQLSGFALKATRYVVNKQSEDGAWAYGAESTQSWRDNFHTAFVLSSLVRIVRYCPPQECKGINEALQRGYRYWRTRFFLADGRPKYYDDRSTPADVHAAASAIVTLSDLARFETDAIPCAEKIADWTIRHLQSPDGFFYYQKGRFSLIRTPFMRWGQAWMLYALARLRELKMIGIKEH